MTSSGFEIAFGTNHVGPFLLTSLLLDRLRESAPARVVTVASGAHYGATGIDFEAVRKPTRTITGMREYSVSKLANVLHAQELGRRLEGTGVTTYALHPGVIASDIWRKVPRPDAAGDEAANGLASERSETSVYCATSPELADQTGRYYDECAPRQPGRPVTASLAESCGGGAPPGSPRADVGVRVHPGTPGRRRPPAGVSARLHRHMADVGARAAGTRAPPRRARADAPRTRGRPATLKPTPRRPRCSTQVERDARRGRLRAPPTLSATRSAATSHSSSPPVAAPTPSWRSHRPAAGRGATTSVDGTLEHFTSTQNSLRASPAHADAIVGVARGSPPRHRLHDRELRAHPARATRPSDLRRGGMLGARASARARAPPRVGPRRRAHRLPRPDRVGHRGQAAALAIGARRATAATAPACRLDRARRCRPLSAARRAARDRRADPRRHVAVAVRRRGRAQGPGPRRRIGLTARAGSACSSRRRRSRPRRLRGQWSGRTAIPRRSPSRRRSATERPSRRRLDDVAVTRVRGEDVPVRCDRQTQRTVEVSRRRGR